MMQHIFFWSGVVWWGIVGLWALAWLMDLLIREIYLFVTQRQAWFQRLANLYESTERNYQRRMLLEAQCDAWRAVSDAACIKDFRHAREIAVQLSQCKNSLKELEEARGREILAWLKSVRQGWGEGEAAPQESTP